jgi:hypothetical protein
MPFIVTAGESKNYTPAPEGTHQAVCVDVIDQGMKPNKFKAGAMQRKVDLAWQIDERRDDGKRFIVYKRYTASLNEKASLRHDLESWRGRTFTRAEEMEFDVESVIGANCLINIQHKGSDDGTKTFANVMSVMPLLKNMAKIAAENYMRPEPKSDAHTEQDAQIDPEPPSVATGDISDSDIPF